MISVLRRHAAGRSRLRPPPTTRQAFRTRTEPSGGRPIRERGRPARILIPFGRTAILEGQRSATTGEGVASTPRATIKRIIHIDAQDAQDFSRILPALNPEHPQARTGSTPEPALGAQTLRPFNPVHPVYPCSKNVDPLRRSRPIQVAEMGKAVPGIVRAGRPRSRVASSHDLMTPRSRSSPDSASRAAASRPDDPVHPVHRCSLDRTSRWICPVAGSARLPPASWSVR